MNVNVASYSLTGNNRRLAESVAQKCSAPHIAVEEKGKRAMGRIVMDLLLNRTPKTKPGPMSLTACDLLIFVGPVWIGAVATPLRAYLKRLKTLHCPYAFLSISGGADGPNPKLASELTRRTGYRPAAVIDLHIADLLAPEPKTERKDTSAYRLTQADVKNLTERALEKLGISVEKENEP